MKKIFVFLISFLCSASVFAQDISGQWNGVLKIQSVQLRVVFHIGKTASGFSTTMDSPDQGAKGIPIKETSFENNVLKLTAPNMGMQYAGTLSASQTISGDFKQAGQTFQLTLVRGVAEKLNRPQTPVEPYPYRVEEVTFTNTINQVNLSGTLSLPGEGGAFPVVILISGSGPQDRNEELFEHKPFLVLSDYLTRNGFAVLRYDDRGIGKSSGNFNAATTQNFALDVESAVSYLKTRKDINPKKIGLIGHSEGGLIAPIVASKRKDIAFIVLLAGPGLPIADLMLLQKEKVERQMGAADQDILSSQETFKGAYQLIQNAQTNDEQLETKLRQHFESKLGPGFSEKELNAIIKQLTGPWFFNFLKLDPANFLKNVKIPVLALNGELDIQVPPKENLQAIKTTLQRSGNKKVVLKELPKLNHLFQESRTGSVSEYMQIEQTFSPLALSEILNWLKMQTN